MPLFIANCTRQILNFSYRLPEQSGVRMQPIQIGQQIQINGPGGSPLSAPDIEAVLKQHEKYGMIDVYAIDRSKPFVGYCYSTDKPIKPDVIMRAVKHNTDVLVQRGKAIRENAAVMTNNRIEQDLLENSGDLNASLRALDLSVVEQEPKSGFAEDTKQVAEGILVTRSPDDGGSARRRRRQG